VQFLINSRKGLQTREKCERMVEGGARLARNGQGGLISQKFASGWIESGKGNKLNSIHPEYSLVGK
jgi:hypothetical protein